MTSFQDGTLPQPSETWGIKRRSRFCCRPNHSSHIIVSTKPPTVFEGFSRCELLLWVGVPISFHQGCLDYSLAEVSVSFPLPSSYKVGAMGSLFLLVAFQMSYHSLCRFQCSSIRLLFEIESVFIIPSLLIHRGTQRQTLIYHLITEIPLSSTGIAQAPRTKAFSIYLPNKWIWIL